MFKKMFPKDSIVTPSLVMWLVMLLITVPIQWIWFPWLEYVNYGLFIGSFVVAYFMNNYYYWKE